MEFEHSNVVIYDSPTAGSNAKRHSLLYKFECQPAHSRTHDQSDPRFVSLLQCRRAPTEPAKPRRIWSIVRVLNCIEQSSGRVTSQMNSSTVLQ